MNQRNRLESGGRIDRNQPLAFTFNGRRLFGFAGDTLASALLANGITVIGRSWKYHRPRGIVTCGVEEPNAIVQLGEGEFAVPNARATQVELIDGLVARSVNGWPSVDWDWTAAIGFFSRFLPPGFYYKTFMWPKGFWKYYEHLIRNASGLGWAPQMADPETYDKCYAHCDVLIAGGGPAGICAALAAARAGARVILSDEQNELGGSLLGSEVEIEGKPGAAWLKNALAELAAMPEVRVIPRGTVYAYVDHNYLMIAERLSDHLPPSMRSGPRERIWRVRARQVVLASGAHERPLVFCNNDRPGVMMASALSAYVNRYAVNPGERALLFTNNDAAYQSALDLHRAGCTVVGVVDPRPAPDGDLIRQVRNLGIELISGSVITNGIGRKRVSGAQVMGLSAAHTVHGMPREIGCDLIGVSGGWSPVVHLSAQSGARARWDDGLACFLPGPPVQAERSAGACAGEFTLAGALAQGRQAGAEAADLAVNRTVRAALVPAIDDSAKSTMPLWLVPGPDPVGRGAMQFVDMQNDVTAADIFVAAREGFLRA